MSLRVVALVALVAAPSACNVFVPLDDPPPRILGLDWAESMYEPEPFVYRPKELGAPLHVPAAEGEWGVVVVPSRDRHVRGLSEADGRILWSVKTLGPNTSPPLQVGEDVLVGSQDGRVYRLHARTGRSIWTSAPVGRGGIASAPVVDGGRVFVTSADNRISALSIEDGGRLWERSRPHLGRFTVTGQAGALVSGESVVTGFSDGYLAAYATLDGATMWSVDFSRGEIEFVDIDTTPVAVDGLIVVAGYRFGLLAVDAATGEERWTLEGEGFGTPATLDGVLYVPRANGTLTAVEGASGEALWTARSLEGVAHTPGLSSRWLVVPLETTMLVVDRATGRTALRYDDLYGFTATPHVSWGTVYAQANSGRVYALGIF